MQKFNTMSLQVPSLPIGSIFYALFSRGDGSFHWALVFPINKKIGVKMHATNTTGAWVFEAVEHDLIKSYSLCVLVKIGASDVQNYLFQYFSSFLKVRPPPATSSTFMKYSTRFQWKYPAYSRMRKNCSTAVYSCPF